jgi:hypothetical protein
MVPKASGDRLNGRKETAAEAGRLVRAVPIKENGSLHCCQGQSDIFGLVSTSCVTRQPKFEFRYHHMNTQ